MIMKDCPKCGSNDVAVIFVPQGAMNSLSLKPINDEFIRSSEYLSYYKLSAKCEHISKHCRECQYKWSEHCLDNLTPIAK